MESEVVAKGDVLAQGTDHDAQEIILDNNDLIIPEKAHESLISENSKKYGKITINEEIKHELPGEESNIEERCEAENKSKKYDNCFSGINRNLLHCKLLYFCYQAALGALWPYLPLYFKQLFLTPRQVGTIVASRTLVQFICVPFWTGIADRYKRHKLIFLIAIFSWLVSTMALLIVPAEQPKACFKMGIKRMAEQDDLEDAWFDFSVIDDFSKENQQKAEKRHRKDVNYGVLIFKANSTNMTAKYSAYDPDQHVLDSSKLFILLLLITIVGMMVSAPSLVLVDIYTLQRLKERSYHFGHQALWGSVGFGFFAFIIGITVNFIHIMNHCTRKADINYVPCFFVFAVFMTITLLVGSQIQFDYDSNTKRPGFVAGLKSIHDIHLFALLIVTFYCGMGSGFISTFLFWHLREMGGVQILMATVTLINSTAEVLFYVLSDRVINRIGHFRVIYLGLICFAVRFFYYSFLRAPWMVLPVEITHGMTSAAIRLALVSYLGKEAGSGGLLQGVFSGVHTGLGFSIGGLTGGIMVHEFGHSITFLIFGEVSLVILFSFILVNNIWPKETSARQDIIKDDDIENRATIENQKAKDVQLDSTSLEIIESLKGNKIITSAKCK